LQTQTSRVLDGLKKDKTTILTDRNGKPQAYLTDSVTFEGVRTRLELLEGIARGERAIEEGRVLTHSQAKKKDGSMAQKKVIRIIWTDPAFADLDLEHFTFGCSRLIAGKPLPNQDFSSAL